MNSRKKILNTILTSWKREIKQFCRCSRCWGWDGCLTIIDIINYLEVSKYILWWLDHLDWILPANIAFLHLKEYTLHATKYPTRWFEGIWEFSQISSSKYLPRISMITYLLIPGDGYPSSSSWKNLFRCLSPNACCFLSCFFQSFIFLH